MSDSSLNASIVSGFLQNRLSILPAFWQLVPMLRTHPDSGNYRRTSVEKLSKLKSVHRNITSKLQAIDFYLEAIGTASEFLRLARALIEWPYCALAESPFIAYPQSSVSVTASCGISFQGRVDGVLPSKDPAPGFFVMRNEKGEVLAAAYGWPNKPRERETISLSTDALAKFAGEYEAGRIGRVQVWVEGDHLVISVPGQGEVPLYAQTSGAFFDLGRGVPDLKFARDETGAASSFTGGNVTAKRVK